ncbi:N-acetylmuramate alpha-1-phosphate uridylyltransferase MurU [Teredinibacter turnerae]|uniref:N-acetylmuramate alpha-1-phosphate uridylyltransferase MurU n=1 Tax=Teredinibacter turnerae TaxID=2426 RepID=UPI000477366B|nr:nucleotidyltransferase family protein [Teredinibacter turnerae]
MIRRAMILAAGEGRRMLPLTLTTPKPLLEVAGKSLIEWHLVKLAKAGIQEVVINIAYLAEQIENHLGNGERYGLRIEYSREPHPLETGGALNAAMPLLGEEPFLLVNGDVWSDVRFEPLLAHPLDPWAAMLILVENPPHNPAGDFALQGERVLAKRPGKTYTFSGISLIDPLTFAAYPQRREHFPLKEYFDWLIARNLLAGESFDGYWLDVGTPERLRHLAHHLTATPPAPRL